LNRVLLSLLAIGWLFSSGVSEGRAQGSAFTFQGRLTSGGSPVYGTYDVSFTLKDSAVGGSSISTPNVVAPLGITNGLFTTLLDFGTAAFDGTPRWLEIGMRTNGSSAAYNILQPRTAINATPYAILSAAAVEVRAINTQIASLASQLATLNAQFSALTNGSPGSIPNGVAVVSADPADAGYLASGLQLFHTVPSPPWVNGSATGVPTARSSHSAVWTGQQLLIWGGDLGGGNSYSAGGAAYNPTTDQWQPIATFQAPTARASHTAVWTGTEMIIWGGSGTASYSTDHGRFNLTAGTWAGVTANNGPAKRSGHVAVWNGKRMIVFGGLNSTGLLGLSDSGGAYDPVSDAWTALPSTGLPEPRRFATAVWTGTEMIVWGGLGDSVELATGGRLACDANGIPTAWTTMSTVGAPSARFGHSAVWTGTKLIIWGGQSGGANLNDGAVYDPTMNTWTALPAIGAPSSRSYHVAVWSGSEMLVSSGEDASGTLPTGSAFDPLRNRWRTLDTSTGALSRSRSTGVWSGTQLVMFGGISAGSPVATLQKLTPQSAWYFYRKP
jgi:N-acetylneuraminic acid mutarotase